MVSSTHMGFIGVRLGITIFCFGGLLYILYREDNTKQYSTVLVIIYDEYIPFNVHT